MIKATGHSSARSQAICPPSLLSDLGAKHHYGKYRKISKDILNEVNFSCINIPNEYSPGANGSLIWQDICKKGRAKVLLKCRQVDTSLPPGKRKVHLQHPLLCRGLARKRTTSPSPHTHFPGAACSEESASLWVSSEILFDCG